MLVRGEQDLKGAFLSQACLLMYLGYVSGAWLSCQSHVQEAESTVKATGLLGFLTWQKIAVLWLKCSSKPAILTWPFI